MPPNEPCPHCGELVLDWHNEWYEAVQRRAISSGQAGMDYPLCRQPVLWFESRDIATPPANAQVPVYQRSAIRAAQWVPIREPVCGNLAGYIAIHLAGQQYSGYWQPTEVQPADQQVTTP
jgi:hypothetical protein